MYDKIAVEFHDQAAHFKEPLCTIILTYGYVKDNVRAT
jgi:energy-converting hydrogenase Eha subunit C